jgi:putative transposase
LREEGRARVDEAAIFHAVERMRSIAEEAARESKLARRQRERRLRLIQGGRIDPAAGDAPVVNDRDEPDTRKPWERMLPVEEWT